MRIFNTLVSILCFIQLASAQLSSPSLQHAQDHNKTASERFTQYLEVRDVGLTAPPVAEGIRTMAEWEEMEAIAVTWVSFKFELSEIIRHAQRAARVLVMCNNAQQARSELTNIYNVTLTDQVEFIETAFNSIWIRDYGPNTVYLSPGDSLAFIDWKYNRLVRRSDDTISYSIAEQERRLTYTTTKAPNDLVHTGGNFMADGLGGGFSSTLVLDENAPGNAYDVSPKSEREVDLIMASFMGLNQYTKFETLPYDGIHHIDMHMKLLDERTLLVGKFPEGVSDGPQIEANLAALEAAHPGKYVIEYIVQPPCSNGQYPPNCTFANEYRTYTNALFINNMILVPIYNAPTDAEALATWRRLKPGFEVIGINCSRVIRAGGAIHCITKEIGDAAPLHIGHYRMDTSCAQQPLQWTLTATHRSGINEVKAYYDTGNGFTSIPMENMGANQWDVVAPPQDSGTVVRYYLEASAADGKQIRRPLAAPQSYFTFSVGACETVNTQQPNANNQLMMDWEVFPNPATAYTDVVLQIQQNMLSELRVLDAMGQTQQLIHQGELQKGENRFRISTNQLAAGLYHLVFRSTAGTSAKRILVLK